jgi:hypothetical protein
LRITSPRLVERVTPALQSGAVTFEACFTNALRSLLNGDLQQGKWIFNEDVDGEIDGPLNDPNFELLKTVLALPVRVHKHMEVLEASSALGELVAVLKLVRCFGKLRFFF